MFRVEGPHSIQGSFDAVEGSARNIRQEATERTHKRLGYRRGASAFHTVRWAALRHRRERRIFTSRPRTLERHLTAHHSIPTHQHKTQPYTRPTNLESEK